MKKLILSAAMIAGLGLLATSQAMAADGTITFEGKISSVTCTVHGGTPGSNSGDFTVTLPEVQASAFAGGIGTQAGAVPYHIYVGEAGEAGCVNGTKVAIHYEPTSPQIAPNGNLNILTGSGAATGVQIQLLNGDNSVIDLRNAPDSNVVQVAGNTADLPFYAQYISSATSVTAGTADSSVLYSVTYP